MISRPYGKLFEGRAKKGKIREKKSGKGEMGDLKTIKSFAGVYIFCFFKLGNGHGKDFSF